MSNYSSTQDPCLFLVRDHDPQALSKSFDELQLFEKDQAGHIIHVCIFLVYLSVYASVCLSVCPSICPFIHRPLAHPDLSAGQLALFRSEIICIHCCTICKQEPVLVNVPSSWTNTTVLFLLSVPFTEIVSWTDLPRKQTRQYHVC